MKQKPYHELVELLVLASLEIMTLQTKLARSEAKNKELGQLEKSIITIAGGYKGNISEQRKLAHYARNQQVEKEARKNANEKVRDKRRVYGNKRARTESGSCSYGKLASGKQNGQRSGKQPVSNER